ncbi:synaptotagmin-2-like isoform X2 [Dendronephthya gigantea]|uniref:synaptotagmin-2-like isoform X2 n=1 Tax=Dendronephthya gigantea TaxID=151771 RepID=UPI00106C4A52|nr:synaptotagmin-2-like isoform X2 [Dendronephthya gigantea]
MMKTMDNYSRRLQNHKISYLTRKQTPVVYPWRSSSVYVHSTTSIPTEAKWNKWFDEHQSLALGISSFLIVILLIVTFCCCRRCCCRKDKKQQAKSGLANHELSMSHDEYPLPRWRKSAVQPKQNKQKEIKELGIIHFSLKYDKRRSQLNVNVLRGEDFPLISSSNVSFTYVVVELQPFSQKYEAKAQTRYARNSISPLFNDTINYQIPIEELQGQSLLLCVYDINHLSAHDLIGSARVNIDGNFLATGAERIYKENLRFEEDNSQSFGEILVGLRWKKDKQTLDVTIQEASCLKIMDQDKRPYVKIQVYINSFLVLKKRTKVEKRTLYPKFRKTFSVQVPGENLMRDTQLVLTVKHVAKFRKKQVIGQIYFGLDGKASTSEQWEIIKKSSEYIEMWHELDAPLDTSTWQSRRSKVNYLLFEDNNSDDNLSLAELSDRSDSRSDSALLRYSRSF